MGPYEPRISNLDDDFVEVPPSEPGKRLIGPE